MVLTIHISRADYVFQDEMNPDDLFIRECAVILPAAPEAPHISSVDYSHGVLYVRWTYGDLFTDLSHSRMLHWQVLAEGKKGSRRHFSTDVRF